MIIISVPLCVLAGTIIAIIFGVRSQREKCDNYEADCNDDIYTRDMYDRDGRDEMLFLEDYNIIEANLCQNEMTIKGNHHNDNLVFLPPKFAQLCNVSNQERPKENLRGVWYRQTFDESADRGQLTTIYTLTVEGASEILVFRSTHRCGIEPVCYSEETPSITNYDDPDSGTLQYTYYRDDLEARFYIFIVDPSENLKVTISNTTKPRNADCENAIGPLPVNGPLRSFSVERPDTYVPLEKHCFAEMNLTKYNDPLEYLSYGLGPGEENACPVRVFEQSSL